MSDSVSLWYGRLTQREQLTFFGLGLGSVLAMLLFIGWILSGSIGKLEQRIQDKGKQLEKILALQGEYQAKKEKTRQLEAKVRKANVHLVSLVETIANQVGVALEKVSPKDSKESFGEFTESHVDFTVKGLSADRLQKFLNELENADGIVIIRNLSLERQYKKDTVDIKLGLTTYRVKS